MAQLPSSLRSAFPIAVLSVAVMNQGCSQQHSLGTAHNQPLYGAQVDVPAPHSGPIKPCQAENERPTPAMAPKTSSVLSISAQKRPSTAEQTLSPGDLLDISLLNGEGFTGHYMIGSDAALSLPWLGAINTATHSTETLTREIELALVKKQLFLASTVMVTVKVLKWAQIDVAVKGAVFSPGLVRINDEKLPSTNEDKLVVFGDHAPSRFLSEALRAASGVRPDADLSRVELIRNGWSVQLNLEGILTGEPIENIALVSGDEVKVPSTGCFQEYLVRPSQITPKGFRVFMSNLTETSKSNANSAIGRYSSNLPYGSRLLQAAVSANCIGGTSWTNAPRRIMLASKNPFSGKTQVLERSLEDLVRNPNRDQLNPYLMPNDAIACYDSDVSNLRDIARTVFDIVSPFSLL